MIIIFYCFLLLFILKLIWNILTPLALCIQKKDKNISMATFVEIFLLILILLTSFSLRSLEWYTSTKNILIYGSGLIVCSYFIMYLVGLVINKLET